MFGIGLWPPESRKMETARRLAQSSFFPEALQEDGASREVFAALEDRIMADVRSAAASECFAADFNSDRAGFADSCALADRFGFDQDDRTVSMRGWVLTGIFVTVSLCGALFGTDFARVAQAFGSSFLLPMGLTIGAAVSIYGAIFIASHLETLEKLLGIEDQ